MKWAAITILLFLAVSNVHAIERITEEDMECLVQNGYFEARSDGYASVMGVTLVVLNRTASDQYPNTICAVVRQGLLGGGEATLRGQCQFSWFCDGKPDIITDSLWRDKVRVIVYETLAFWYSGIDITEGATHYHADYVDPAWASDLHQTIRIGGHRYYK